MKKALLHGLFSILLFFALAPNASATHVAGADFSFVCIGQDSFLVTLNIFRDCSGAGISTTAPTNVSFTSTCGGSVNVSLAIDTFLEVSQLCSTQVVNSTCNGGTLPGMQQYIYSGIVVLTPPCNSWTAAWTLCCRNTSVNAIGQGTFAITANLNTVNDPCNNTPVFTAQPIPYVCANQTVNYNFAVTEFEGDSLVYSLVNAVTNAGGTSINYAPGYSAGQPIPGIVLNAQNGQLTFTPTMLGIFIVTVQVDEYDPITGLLLSSIRRDIQFIVQVCTNSVPTANVGGISNVQGTALQIDSITVQACYGDSMKFDFGFTDTDTNDILTLTSNVDQILPGAVFTSSGPGSAMTGTVEWLAVPGTPAFNTFNIFVDDGACPVAGILNVTIVVLVSPGVYAGEDDTICGAQVAPINAVGDSAQNMTWSVISGDPITIGTNFTCNPCSNPVATPSVTTTYEVTGGSYQGVCGDKDTITIVVAPDYNIVMPSDTHICNSDTIPLPTNLVPFPISPPAYTWSPTATLSASNIPNPTALPDEDTYYVLTVNAGGCVKSDSTHVTISPPFPTGAFATAEDTVICLGTTSNLFVDLGTIIYDDCGVAANGCEGIQNDVTIGNGTLTNSGTTFPTPYGNWFWGNRTQYLYTAAELNAAGIFGGQIEGFSFFIQTMGAQTTYQNYEVKIGCTNINAMSANWVSGLTVVSPASNFTVSQGWNQHAFATPYNWDGTSNIVIEVCSNNFTFTANGNAQVRFTTTAFNSTLHFAADNANVCTTGGPNVTNNRANIRFHTCSGANPSAYNYAWSPGTYLNNTNIYDPLLNANTIDSLTYTVVVSDTFAVCFDTFDVNIEIVASLDATIGAAGPYCFSDLVDTLIAATAGGFFTGNGIVDSIGIFDPGVSGPGTFPVIYSFGGGCQSADTIDVIVSDLPNTTITSLGPFCEQDNAVQLTSSVPGGAWSGTGVVNPATGLFNATLFTAPATTQIIYFRDSICQNADTVTVDIIAQLNSTITPIPDLCEDTALITLNAVDTGGVWSGTGISDPANGVFAAGIAGPGTHQIIYAFSGNCATSDTISITVNPLPFVSITGLVPDYCDNNTTVISASGGTSGGTWGGTGIVNANFGDFVPSQLGSSPNPYTITYTLQDGNGCVSSDSSSFFVRPSPNAPGVSLDPAYCEGDLLDNILATNLDTSSTVYWFRDAFGTDTIDSGTPLNAGIATTTTTLYVSQINQFGCISGVDPFTVNVNPAPVASFSANITTGAAPLNVNFSNFSTTEPLTYLWDFADGDMATTKNVNHEFQNFGVYPVSLVVTDPIGCDDTAFLNINVLVNINVFIPNVFTPNGDGQNDVFRIDFIEGIDAVQSFEGVIFNRWGRKVYEFRDQNDVWDGGDQIDGVYYYVVNINAVNGDTQEHKGAINLIRNE